MKIVEIGANFMEDEFYYISESSPQVDEAMDTIEAGISNEESVGDEEVEKDVLTWLLGELLDKYVRQTHPNVRQVCEPIYLFMFNMFMLGKYMICIKHYVQYRRDFEGNSSGHVVVI